MQWAAKSRPWVYVPGWWYKLLSTIKIPVSLTHYMDDDIGYGVLQRDGWNGRQRLTIRHQSCVQSTVVRPECVMATAAAATS